MGKGAIVKSGDEARSRSMASASPPQHVSPTGFDSLAIGRDNGFDFVRLLAACAVILAHSYPLSGVAPHLVLLDRYDLGGIAVIVFFGLSGFLITKSFLRSNSITEYAGARLARIMPALIVVQLLTVLILGPALTTLPLAAYFGSKETWSHLAHNIALWDIRYALPGVFLENPYPAAVNGSIWTLPFEMVCYIAIGLFGLVGALKLRYANRLVAGFIGSYLVYRLAIGEPSLKFYVTVLPFIVGAGLYLLRDRVSISPLVLLILVIGTFLLRETAGVGECFVVTVVYGAFWISNLPFRFMREAGRWGDFSYGIYIYGFPVGQLIVLMRPGVEPLPLAAATAAVTLPLAVLSWHLIEKPALAHRKALSQALSRLARLRTTGMPAVEAPR